MHLGAVCRAACARAEASFRWAARGGRTPHPRAPPPPPLPRLKDVEHNDNKLYLVFEWVDRDLKKFMDSLPPQDKERPYADPTRLVDMRIVKSFMYQVRSHARGRPHPRHTLALTPPPPHPYTRARTCSCCAAWSTATRGASCTATSSLKTCSSTRTTSSR